MRQALPPVPPGTPSHRGNFSSGESPGGSAAPIINLLTTITSGLQTGAIPSDWFAGVCHTVTATDTHQLWLQDADPLLPSIPRPQVGGIDRKIVRERTCDTPSYAFDIPHAVRLADCKDTAKAEAQAVLELESLTPVAMAQYLSGLVMARATRPNGDTAVSMERAIGILHESRSLAGPGGGMLHIPDRAVPVAKNKELILRGGTRYSSTYGDAAIVGPGTLPDGPADSTVTNPPDGQAWLAVSSTVDYATSPIETLSTDSHFDDLAKNYVAQAVVERRAILRLDDENVFAVLVDLAL